MPVFSNIKKFSLETGISSAAYHGRKLNGVDGHEHFDLVKPIFECFKNACSPFYTLKGILMY
jgi:hypothetical protein